MFAEGFTQETLENATKMPTLTRAFLAFHHIRDRVTRARLDELAGAFRVTGLCKVNWPGYIYVEGETSAVYRYIHEIRQMQWQYVHLRKLEAIDIETVPAQLKQRYGIVEVKKVKEMGR